VLLLLCCAAGMARAGQKTPGSPEAPSLWIRVHPSDRPQGPGHPLLPRLIRHHVVRLELEAMRRLLAPAPLEFTLDDRQSPVIVPLPMPDGNLLRFCVVESPILGPELAAERPDIRTYAAYGIDDPTAIARIDINATEFHAMVLSEHGTVFIDPYRSGSALYLIYDRQDALPAPNQPVCLTDPALTPLFLSQIGLRRERWLSSGTFLREYRLAISCTGEYGAAAGGTVAMAQNRIVTTVNRVDGVYQRDFSIRLRLVATRIYLDGRRDPFDNNDPIAMLGQNQTELDTHVGPANYDVGHVFATGGGGVAILGSVCAAGWKARGVSGLPNPVGDPFDIDYVAHEIGHQFGANHSFNSSSGACNGNRNASTAYEPGSGSTIMGYAGICGSDNIQSNSDPYFHIISLDEVIAFRDAAGACVAQISTGNTPPTVSAGPNVTIPTGTPFRLQATASDPNGDALTYCWEQFDLGTTASTRPLFRSRLPSSDPSRTLPRFSTLLGTTTDPWETLPTVNRTLRFRCTVRDQRGGVASAIRTITVSGAPFRVTVPNTAVSWTVGSTQTIRWDVGGGSVAANVRISISTDGGSTFTTLVSSTPNDGSEIVTMPLTASTRCRVQVEAIGNIFFDISDVNFTLVNPTPVIASITPSRRTQGGAAFTLSVLGSGFVPSSVVRWNGSDRPTTFVSSTRLTANIPASDLATPGTYNITVFNPAPGGGTSVARPFTVNPNRIEGTIVFERIADPRQPVTFEFRPTSGGSPITRTLTLSRADSNRGAFSFTDVPPGAYRMAVKGSRWLREVVAIDTIEAGVTDIEIFFRAGDANNDNAVDVSDLDILIAAFDSSSGDPAFRPGADLDCDNTVDVLDLDLLLWNFDAVGAP
ncbi:MAG: M12 family metallo-peptidase, partial [Chloroherpetonaceae bacterium]|nr:M12 family metallo-peptidase [Chloroherpetonaceae bacterium]